MTNEIRVRVFSMGRKHFYMRYLHPQTRKVAETKSTHCTRRKDAERVAAKWEHDLREGRYKPPSKVTWQEFRERYEAEALPSLASRALTRDPQLPCTNTRLDSSAALGRVAEAPTVESDAWLRTTPGVSTSPPHSARTTTHARKSR